MKSLYTFITLSNFCKEKYIILFGNKKRKHIFIVFKCIRHHIYRLLVKLATTTIKTKIKQKGHRTEELF